jgi:hypothetical protein
MQCNKCKKIILSRYKLIELLENKVKSISEGMNLIQLHLLYDGVLILISLIKKSY